MPLQTKMGLGQAAYFISRKGRIIMEQHRLRAMGVGDLLDSTISLYRNNFSLFIGIAAVLHVPFTILTMCLRMGVVREVVFSPIMNQYLLIIIQYGIVNPLVTGALIFAIAEEYLGRKATIGDSFGHVRYWSIIGGSLLMGIVIGGIILLSGGIVALTSVLGAGTIGILLALPVIGLIAFFAVRWSFFCQAIMVEKYTAYRSLARSWRLVAGTWWRVAGILLLLLLLQFILIYIPPGLVGISLKNVSWSVETKIIILTLVTLIFTVIAIPLYIIGQTLLYFDLRIRKEAFDIEVMAQNLGRESAEEPIFSHE